MTINELIRLLKKVPEDKRDNAVLVFDKKTATYHPLVAPKKYLDKEDISVLNPLLLEINGHRN